MIVSLLGLHPEGFRYIRVDIGGLNKQKISRQTEPHHFIFEFENGGGETHLYKIWEKFMARV